MGRPKPETPFKQYSDEELNEMVAAVDDGDLLLEKSDLSESGAAEQEERLDALRRRVELLLEYNKRQLESTTV